MMNTLSAFFSKPLTRILGSYLLVFALGIGAGVYGHVRWQTPPAPETIIQEHTVFVPIKGDTITEITKVPVYFENRKEIERLLNEAAAAENKITILLETNARLELDVKNALGDVVYVNVPGKPLEVHYSDFRLKFDTIDAKASYKLTQTFFVDAVLGKRVDGMPYADVSVSEVEPPSKEFPEGKKNSLTTKTFEGVSKDGLPPTPRWFLTGSIQAGFGYTYDVAAKKSVSGGVVGLQWLKRGYTKAAEDGMWSVATPVAFISSAGAEAGILPVSVNLGRIRHQPFKDIWASPLVVFGKAPNLSATRVGFILSASF